MIADIALYRGGRGRAGAGRLRAAAGRRRLPRRRSTPAAPLLRTTARPQHPDAVRRRLWRRRGGIRARAARVHSNRSGSIAAAAHPIEGRGVLAASTAARTHADPLVLDADRRTELAFTLAACSACDESAVRVIAPDVGGGFGAKFLIYPEEVAVAAARRLLRRPVKWIEDRREHFVAPSRSATSTGIVEIAVDADGTILGVRGQLHPRPGRLYAAGRQPARTTRRPSVTGPYIVPAYSAGREGGADQQGAGHRRCAAPAIPQAAFAMERMLDRVARELELDRAEVRRRNLDAADEDALRQAAEDRAGAPVMLDSGDYPGCQDEALASRRLRRISARGRREARARRAATSASASPMASRAPAAVRSKPAMVRVAPSGKVTVYTGAPAMGQGTRPMLAQICAEQLGVRLDDVIVPCRATPARSPLGHRRLRQPLSRHRRLVGASRRASRCATRRCKVAARLLEVAERGPRASTDGKVRVKGVPDMSVTLGEIARAARRRAGLRAARPASSRPRSHRAFRAGRAWPMPTAAHVVRGRGRHRDRRRAHPALRRRCTTAARLINPMIVEGQVIGGVAHGIGNALFEWMGFDENGQPVTTNFAEYCCPPRPRCPASR